MKIALIGTGKTGGRVAELIPSEQLIGPFNSRHAPTLDELSSADATIIFTPGTVVEELIDVVMASGKPAVWGSTGFTWPEGIEHKLIQKGLCWAASANFSLAMPIIQKMIQALAAADDLLEESAFSLHETHHTAKKDGPSGTALQWKSWLRKEADVSFSRKGDITGIHTLQLKTPYETITLQHEALDRALFAKGALWTAKLLAEKNFTKPGLHTLQCIVEAQLEKK